MRKAEAFLRIYPSLHVLMRDGFYIWELVWNEAARIAARKDRPRDTREDVLKMLNKARAAGNDVSTVDVDQLVFASSFRGWKKGVLARCADFARALSDPEIRAIGSTFHEQLSHGYSLLKRARNDEQIVDCEKVLDDGLDELYAFYNESVKSSLGEWGAWFFEQYIEETSPGLGFPDCTFQRPLGLDNYRGKRPDWIPQFTEDDLFDTVAVDEATFSIRWGERDPCRLGNSKPFHFFKVLFDARGKFVSFSEIAERMGGDAYDVDVLAVVKRRLIQSLKLANYDVIARAIQAEAGHYGLFI